MAKTNDEQLGFEGAWWKNSHGGDMFVLRPVVRKGQSLRLVDASTKWKNARLYGFEIVVYASPGDVRAPKCGFRIPFLEDPVRAIRCSQVLNTASSGWTRAELDHVIRREPFTLGAYAAAIMRRLGAKFIRMQDDPVDYSVDESAAAIDKSVGDHLTVVNDLTTA